MNSDINIDKVINFSQVQVGQYIWMSLIVDKKGKTVLTARIYYKENYLKPNSDPDTLQTPVLKAGTQMRETDMVGI